jgi:Peptidase family M1 domain
LLTGARAADDERAVKWVSSSIALALAAAGLHADVRDVAREMPALGASAAELEPIAAHADDVVDYTLRATLDPAAHTVHGEGTIVWRNASVVPVHELWLHLYLNAFKNQGSAFWRERVGGRGSAPPEDWGWIDVRKLALRGGDGEPETTDLWPAAELHRPAAGGEPDHPGPQPTGPIEEDETDVRVPLPREVPSGGEITLDVAFDDKLPAVVLRTGYRGRFHMVGQWFPKIARLERSGRWAHFPLHHLSEFYADFGTYDVTLDVPEAFTIGATGPLVESRLAGGRRVERHVQRDVHDFAWTAWDQFDTRRETIDGVQVTLLSPPGYAAVARRELAALRFTLPYFSARYGRYPYDVLTVVHPPEEAEEAGGMEYPTLITSDGPWWIPAGVRVPELVTIHELGHQWFYGLVATDERSWPVLDEGLNEFAEIDAMAKWHGEASLVDLVGLSLSDATVEAVGGTAGVHDEPVAQAADAFSNGTNYGRLVYARTASVIETLARVYGDDAVGDALGRYTRRYRFAHPDPDDLIEVFHEAMGERVAETLRVALFEKGWVDYAVDGVWTEEAQRAAGVFDREGQRETVPSGASDGGGWDSAVIVRRRGTLAFPVDVELTFEDGSTHRERWDGDEPWRRFAWHGPSRLRAAIVDPDDRVRIDANLSNNFGAAQSGGAGAGAGTWTSAPRTFERATYFMQLALQAVSP